MQPLLRMEEKKSTDKEEALLCLHKVLMPIATTEEMVARTHELRQQFVCDEGRLADAIKRLEEGDPCLL